MNLFRQSVNLHRKHGGKLEVSSKISLNDSNDLSLAYTPGVARVCEEIAKDKTKARELTWKKNTIAIVTDGSSVLGLGNLGPDAALPVMEGKAVLFKELGGVDAVPICLNTQNTEEIISIVKNIAPTFGGINLEDISAPRCFEIEKRLKAELNIPVLHDDQQGTAVVVLAALINALKAKGLSRSRAKIVINGAGAAGTAISRLLNLAGFKNLIVCDRAGIINLGRKNLEPHKAELAKFTNQKRLSGGLQGALKNADVFIGVSAKNILTTMMIKVMAKKPIVFALANPYPEINPQLAKQAGAYIVATGSSSDINQINNILSFPGIFRGALDNNIIKITPKMLIRVAENLSACVRFPKPNKILPSVFDKNVVKAVAKAIKN